MKAKAGVRTGASESENRSESNIEDDSDSEGEGEGEGEGEDESMTEGNGSGHSQEEANWMSGTKPKWWLGALVAAVLLALVQAGALADSVPGAPVPEKTPTNDPTPTWTWSAVDGATSYWVYLDDATVATVTTPTYTHGTPLSEGLHYLQVTVWVGGTESAKSGKGWVEIDVTPPAAPVMDALPAYVNSNSLTFRWSGPGDAATYTLYWRTDGTGVWAPVTGLGVATYSVDISGVTDGVLIEGKVVAYDAAGNASAESGVVSTRVDRTRPTVNVVAPTATLTTNNPRPAWSWAGDDVLSGVKGYWVTLDAELPVWTTGTAFIPSSNLVDGAHIMIVKAVDNAGNESQPLAFPEVVVDTTPPAVPGAPSTASPTTDTTPTWSWDAVAGVASYNVYLDDSATRLNSAPVTTLSSVASFTHTDPLPEGEHRLQVTSVDDVGNESDRSAAGTVVVDLTGPVAPVVTQLPQYTRLTSLPFAWSAPADAVSYTFYYNIAGAPTWASIDGLSSPAYTMDVSGATDGTVIRAKVVAYDAAGNASPDSNIVTTTVDRTLPTVTAIDPMAPLRTKDKTPTWQWSGSDTLSGIASYLISLNGGTSESTTATSFTPAYELPDGPYVLTVKAIDAAGNESAVFSFETVTVDTTPPPVPSMPLTTSPTNVKTPTWSWNDLGAGVGYNVYLDGAAIPLNATPLATHSFTHAADLAEGEHYLQVTSLDDLGNESAPSEAGYVTIDITPPAAPVMTALPSYTKDTAVVFAWSGPTDSAEYTFSYSKDGGGSWTDALDLTNSTYTVDISAAVDGDVILGKVVAYDAAGNPSEASNTVSTMVDRTGPVTTPATTPVSPTTNPRPTWSWTGSDDIASEVPGSGIKGYWVTLDGEPPIWTTGTSFTPSADLASGGHVLKVMGVDNLDSAGAEITFDTVLVDTVPPAAPAIAPLDEGYNTLPIALGWNAVTDGGNAISYVLEWADNAGFSGAVQVPLDATAYDFTPPAEGQYWFRVKTVSTVNPGPPAQTKESAWSAVATTVYDATAPGAPALTLETPNPTNESPQRWSWNTPDGAVGFDVSVNGGEWTRVGNVTTYETTFTESGTYTFAVRAYDWLENTGTQTSKSVVVDVTAPGVPAGLAVDETPTTDRTPRWTWTASTGDVASYEVVLDDAAAVNVGNVTEYTAPELGDGTHSLKVRALDALGNASGWTDAVSVEVDTTAPAIPAAPVPSETPTADRTPTWTWNAVADWHGPVTYDVYLDGTRVAQGQAATSWTPAADLADGSHYLQVAAMDDLGNTSVLSERGYVMVDTTGPAAPALTLVTPSPTNKAPQIWTWTRPADAVRYEFGESVDGVTPPAIFADVGNVDTYATSFTTDGTHYVMVRAYDALGNPGAWSEAASVEIDRAAPDVPTMNPLPPYTAGTRNTVSWTPTPAGAPEDGDGETLEYYVECSDGSAATLASGWIAAAAYTFEGLADGVTYSYKVKARDALGNESGWSAPVTSTQDATPPAVPVMAAEPDFTKGSANTVSWSASSDGDHGSGLARYEIRMAETQDGLAGATPEPIAAGDGTSKAYADLADGQVYYYQVRAVDAVDNASAWSNIVSSRQDAAPPAMPQGLAAPSTTSDQTPEWTWNAPDEHGIGYWVSLGTKAGEAFTWSAWEWVGAADRWSPKAALAEGTYRLRVKAEDAAALPTKPAWEAGDGNQSEAAESADVLVDVTAPMVQFVNPTHGATLNINKSSTILLRATGYTELRIKVDNEDWVKPQATFGGSLVFYFVAVPFTEGQHAVTAKAWDAAGNVTEVSVMFAVEATRQGFGFGRFRFDDAP